MDRGILLLLVPFSIFFTVPKAQCQNPIGFYIRYQKGLIHESGLFFQNRQFCEEWMWLALLRLRPSHGLL